MGLDITHYQATLEQPENLHPSSGNFILESEFGENGFAVSFDHFSDCIQLIDHPVSLQTIICPLRETEIGDVRNWFLASKEYAFLFEPDLSKLEEIIKNFLISKGLEDSLLYTWKTDRWIGFEAFITEKKNGFYFKEVGYQRKGINENFWTRFSSDTIYSYTEKEDFDFAYSCVDYYWDTDTEEDVILRRRLFKEHFVEQFEAGKSWMDLSY